MASAKSPQRTADDVDATQLQPDDMVALGPDTALDDTEDDGFNSRGSYTIAFAHFSHDVYSSFRDPLIPIIVDKLGISIFLASLMVPDRKSVV